MLSCSHLAAHLCEGALKSRRREIAIVNPNVPVLAHAPTIALYDLPQEPQPIHL